MHLQLQEQERVQINATRDQQQSKLISLNLTTTDKDGNELSAERRLQMRLEFLAQQAHTFAGGGTWLLFVLSVTVPYYSLSLIRITCHVQQRCGLSRAHLNGRMHVRGSRFARYQKSQLMLAATAASRKKSRAVGTAGECRRRQKMRR